MVAGMAMAAWATADVGVGHKDARPYCIKHGQTASSGAHLDIEGRRIGGYIVKPFTPIHIGLPMLLTSIFDVFIWG